MKRTMLATAIALLASTSVYAAGDSAEALEIARAQEACGDGMNARILSARYLEDGRIGVRCASGAVLPGAGGGAAGGAVAPNFVPALGGLVAVVLGAAAVGGSSSSTSDTQ